MNINMLYDKYLKMTEEERVKEARKSSKTVAKYLLEAISPDHAEKAYFLLIGSYVAVDGIVDRKEYEFFKKVFDFEYKYEDFAAKTKDALLEHNLEFLDSIIDAAPGDVKDDFIRLGAAICASNGQFSAAERALLEKYHAK